MTISIIIPTYNEANHIAGLISSIINFKTTDVVEVLVIDSRISSDNLRDSLAGNSVKYIKSDFCSRATQMNYGAKLASGDVLFFVHADTVLPDGFVIDIHRTLLDYDMGCYRSKIDSKHPLLRINSYFTRFDFLWCRGGDQTLFIRKEVFDKLGGFDENYVIMEDYDFLRRAREFNSFYIVPKSVLISARKYDKNGFWKIQKANFKAMRMFLSGKYSPEQIKNHYSMSLNLHC
jgi:rSAM/selenodomain-associated transferase 2